MKVRAHWERNFLLYEGAIPFLLAGLLALYVFGLDGAEHSEMFLKGKRVAIYGATTAAAAGLLGTTIAAVAIILGWIDSPRLIVLRNSERYSELWVVFKQSMWFLAVLTLLSLICLPFDRDKAPVWALTVLFVLVSSLATVRLARVIWVVHRLVEILAYPDDDRAERFG